MNEKLLYRVDKRIFKEGDIIMPSTTFEGQMNEDSKEVEKMLNEKRNPSMPERSQCLFLFQDFSGALRHFSKYGGTIYEVLISSSIGKIYHRGDMNKLDNILNVFKTTRDDHDGLRSSVVYDYWKGGTHTFNPCYEILVSCARVEKIVLDEMIVSVEQVKNELLNNDDSIENTPTYINFIKYYK